MVKEVGTICCRWVSQIYLTTLRRSILPRIAIGASKYWNDAKELYFWERLTVVVELPGLLRCSAIFLRPFGHLLPSSRPDLVRNL